ncbi:hypothetical protein CQW23_31855 [Capsicum baccatum]|uniref:Ubiquitin-like protease family profile domain-containing protein n=1 Tax=Capsicum baccatum TaxID=33114 RepID=A0A2G2V6G2_CAPBA|nr:hypothetical protein CQW23_31855 [Capsicum baccatum]
MIAPCSCFEFLMNAMFKEYGKVVFKNIEPTKIELAKLEIRQKNVTEDECSVDSDDDFQDPPPKKINEHSKKKQKVPSSKIKKGKQIARVIFPLVQSKSDSHVEKVVVSKSESHVEKEAFISKKVFDAFCDEQQHEDTNLEAQQMDYAGVETSPQQFSPIVDQNLDENQDATKGCTDFHPDKINIEIDSQYLIRDELLQSINLDYNLSEKIVHHDVRITDEKMNQTNLSDSQFIIPDELLPSLNAYRRVSITTDHRSYKFNAVDCNFMNIIRPVHDVYSVDDVNLIEGGQAAHHNEYINGFRMHAAVSWHTVEDIYIPVNIKEKHHWVLVVLSFLERCIFLYDSYESSGHYLVVLAEIEKLSGIISLCLQQSDFYVKKGIDVENHSRYKDKDSSDMDCGLFMVTYAECLSNGHKVLANEFDSNALRKRYVALLWDYETRKQDTNAHSDVEAPLKAARQSRITSVTEIFDV